MAEALAAVALAGNVLQFFQTATGFALSAGKMCRSQLAGEASEDLKELRTITTDLQALLQKLRPPGAPTPDHRMGLTTLSQDCAEMVQTLLTQLDKIGLNGQGRVDLVLAEFRATWHSEAIRGLETRIARFREQLALQLVFTVKDLVMQSLAQQDNILSELRQIRSRTGVASPTATPGSRFIDALSGFLDDHEEENRRQLSLLRTAMHVSITETRDRSEGDASQLNLSDTSRSALQQAFISKFHYEERGYRESAIKEPYQKTFKWIFHDGPFHTKTSFSRWLRSDDAMFWVTGKAGSGKSTLMKYISDPRSEGAEKCQQHLSEWAGKSRLLTARFYFWASGTAIERSQDALFKSLLYQIFQQSPDIIPQVAPGPWESLCLLGPPLSTDWSGQALQQILLYSVEAIAREGNKICFFIDGLDEFEGDLSFLISTIHQVSRVSGVKLCVSSRPWTEFEQAFSEKPSLRVQDLTSSDIQHYVRGHFGQNSEFKTLQEREPDFSKKLLLEIVEKSAGVFLWVHLVVATLIAGLGNGDRVVDLKRRLDNLPPELENIYARILKDVDPFYYEHACQFFKLIMTCGDPPDALLISFADEDLDYAIELPTRTIRSAEKESRIETLRRRLNSRCKGLLEIGKNNRVNFLHRTARDFIASREVTKQMDEALQRSKFDPHVQLCSAELCMLKTDGSLHRPPNPHANCLWSNESLERCLVAASKITQQTLALRLLDSLRKALDATGCSPLFCSLLPAGIRANLRLRMKAGEQYIGNSFLALATRFGLVGYLAARVPDGACCNLETNAKYNVMLRFASWRLQTRGIAARIRNFIPDGFKSPRRGTAEIGSESGKWPLLLAACFTYPPDFRVFKCLLEHGAKYDAPWDFGGAVFDTGLSTAIGQTDSILPVILAISIVSMLRERNLGSSESTWISWVHVVRLLQHYHATYSDDVRLAVEDWVYTAAGHRTLSSSTFYQETGRPREGVGRVLFALFRGDSFIDVKEPLRRFGPL